MRVEETGVPAPGSEVLTGGDESRPRLVTLPFVVVVAASFAYFLAFGALLPTIPRLVVGPLAGGSLAVGLAVGAFSLSAMLLRPVAGRVGDRRGRRMLTVGGAAVVALSVAGYGLARSVPVLAALRLLTGVGEALFFVGAVSVVNDLAPESRRGEALSLFTLALYGGLAVGPAVGEAVLARFGFDAVWWAAAVAAAVAGGLGMCLPETRPAGAAPGRPPPRLLHRAAVVPGGILATSVIGFTAFAAFVPLYALELGMSGSTLVLGTYSAIILAIRGLGAPLPDRLGPARTAGSALAASITGLALMGAWAEPAGLFWGAALLAVGQALAFPALMTLAVRAGPASERGSVVGAFTAFFDLAFGLGGLAMGAVAAAVGYRGAFVVAAGVAAVGLAAVTRVCRGGQVERARRRTREMVRHPASGATISGLRGDAWAQAPRVR